MICLDFNPLLIRNYRLNFFHQALSRKLRTCLERLKWKLSCLEPGVENFVVPKIPKNATDFEFSRYSNTFFAVISGLILKEKMLLEQQTLVKKVSLWDFFFLILVSISWHCISPKPAKLFDLPWFSKSRFSVCMSLFPAWESEMIFLPLQKFFCIVYWRFVSAFESIKSRISEGAKNNGLHWSWNS